MASNTMAGLVNFAAAPHSVEIEEVDVPEIGEDDVLLAVGSVSICGSDLHQYHGTHSWKVNYPVVLGHEFAGTVTALGNRVSGFKEGDRVVSETAAVIDMQSPFTRAGQYNLDPGRLGFGYGVNGAMTKYVRVPARCLHHLPDTLSFDKAALTEPCCVAYNATCVHVRIKPGDLVVVLGPGPIGLLCAIMARLSGANPMVVIGTERDRSRLAIARKIGATHTIGADGENTLDAIKTLGDGYGADVVIDAAGVSASLKTAIDIVRPAGQISKVGWGPQPLNFNLDPLVAKAATLQGSFSHNWPIWERVISMIASGQIDLDPIISRSAPMDDWKSCFDGMASGELVKAVLKP